VSEGGHAVVPGGFRGHVAVVAGPRILAGVPDGPSLAAHRRRWPLPPQITADELVTLAGRVDTRGRGGAAFPFARKLSACVDAGRRRSVVINASEGEPGSAKDSGLLLTVPHLVLDGAELVAEAIGTDIIHIVVPGDRPNVRPAVESAIAERQEDGGGLSYIVDQTSGGFVGGQARAVIELLSGRDNLPVTSWAPEAINGLKSRPTLLSNAETFAQVSALVTLGAAGYARVGTPEEPGTTLLTVAGDGPAGVVLEVPFGVPLADVLDHCGHTLDAPVLMGGYHGTWLSPHDVAVRRILRSDLAASGAVLGAGVVLPVDAGACPIDLTARIVAYLAGQSARRCGPCRNGLPALSDVCAVLAAGRAGQDVIDRIQQLAGLLPGRGSCAHPDGTVRLVASLLRTFPEEVATHVHGSCSNDSVTRRVAG
jgi:NADH:ubiquinone oxidoreductase subunit F (NADH-binding)